MIVSRSKQEEKCEYEPEERDGMRKGAHMSLGALISSLVVVEVEPELLAAVCNKKLQELKLLLLRKLPKSFFLFVRYKLTYTHTHKVLLRLPMYSLF